MAMDYQLGLDTSKSRLFVNTVSDFPSAGIESWSLQRQNPLGDGLGGFLFPGLIDLVALAGSRSQLIKIKQLRSIRSPGPDQVDLAR
jgi:hypothetical protein